MDIFTKGVLWDYWKMGGDEIEISDDESSDLEEYWSDKEEIVEIFKIETNMSNMSEDIQYAGSDTRPPMLDRTDFESWQQRIRLYCLGKDNGENIMKSITEGPFQMGTMRDTLTEGGEGALHLGPERARVFADLSAEQKDRYKADIRATNILLQGIPKDIYTLINHFTDAKDIWDNVKMILEGSELTKDDRESQLYDEFERFCQIKGETIHVYYVRFSKLINDMRNIKMTMSRMQLNSKFVNNMLPEWSRFITEVKLNRGLKESNFDQLYAYLKQHEVHANENRMMMERFIQPTDDPLALVSNASNQKYPTQSSESPQSSNQPSIVDNCQMDTGSTSTDNLIESLTNTLALLNQSFKAHLPQTNNQLRTSSNARNNATVQDDRVVVQDVRGRYNANNQGRPFQRNNARGNVEAGNEKARINTSTKASGSKPRSNTKKNRILPAKSENKKKVEDHPRTNKSVWTKVNRVDSSISSKRVVINSNSESVCKMCNKCLNSANHEMCVVNMLSSVNATPTVKIVLNKGKQIWKPKGKLSDNNLNKTKRV
ncbi:hypothetical protein Tco_1143428 [Tanacetum coccineum]